MSGRGVDPSQVFPHSLRHLFARVFYSVEKDLLRLADILGHASVNTTRIYTMETARQCHRTPPMWRGHRFFIAMSSIYKHLSAKMLFSGDF